MIEDVAIGNVLNQAAGATEHRGASLAAGIPYTAAFLAINRLCSSGLMAISDIANKIKTGEIECGLAGGIESMSKNYGSPKVIPKIDPHLADDEQMSKCLIPMGITNENVANEFNIPREKQDAFAAKSYSKAEKPSPLELSKMKSYQSDPLSDPQTVLKRNHCRYRRRSKKGC